MPISRCFALAGLLAALGPIAPARGDGPGEPIPEPAFDRVDYAKPGDYLGLDASFGDPERIRAIAAPLTASRPERSLAAIGRWISANLRYDDKAAYAWRDCGAIVDSKAYGGCADHALLFGALARAAGIPTVWVKTMDADWIREFRAAGSCTSWRGHVFLEVYLDGRWRLLDAQEPRIYDDYRTDERLLPGGRFAYDKGGDPRALILSTDWERWKVQTARHFARFDLARLPVGGGRPIGKIHVVANSPAWQMVDGRVRALGQDCFSFNNGYEKHLLEARGGTLILAGVGPEPVLPAPFRDRYLPISPAEVKARLDAEGQGFARKRLDDGTRLIWIFARDLDGLRSEIDRLVLPD